jgi:hypothetical protein
VTARSRGWETNSGSLVDEVGMLNRVTKRDGGERVGFGMFACGGLLLSGWLVVRLDLILTF